MIRRPFISVCCMAMCVLAVAGVRSVPAHANEPADCYSLALTALTGPKGADAMLDVSRTGECAAVHLLKKVQVKTYEPDGSLAGVDNYTDVRAPGGEATLDLGQVESGRRVETDVLVQSAPGRTHVIRKATTTRLRPDLEVVDVFAPPQTTTSRSIDVVVDLAELNGETGATAKVALMLGPAALAEPVEISLAPGAKESVTFRDIALPSALRSELTAFVTDAAPFETDTTNNDGATTIDVTEHELQVSNVLVPSLGGYGAQLNQHVYAPITNLPQSSFPDLETAVKDFEPQLVRIFYNENFEEVGQPRYDPENIVSFRKTVALAQAAGATINITYHSVADAKTSPGAHMQRFAAMLEELVETRGLTNVRWVTVGNEPNTSTNPPSAALTLEQWHALYLALHNELVARGLRDHIRIMGGDLIENGGARDHEVWFKYMTANMADIVDAYSEHIYWWYDTFNLEGARRFEFRLRDIRKLVVDDNPPERRRPAYIMEFAVRGHNAAPGRPTVTNHEYYKDGTEMRRTNVAAFQQLWFTIASAQLGFYGAAKWDLYWGKYDFTNPPNQSYWMINPTPEGWELFPSYHALRLMLQTTQRGWEVVRIDPWERNDWDPVVADRPEKELAAYLGPRGETTLIGLDSNGRLLNTASAETGQYSIGGLPPRTQFNLALWNAAGDGQNTLAGTVMTNEAGVARFEVPLHAAFALTTVTVS
jgi:hypothetical protein